MKKSIIAILALTLILSLAACGGSSEPAAPQEVQLTTENINDYLALEFDYSKVERETKIGLSFGYTDITLKSYAVAPGSFSNAEITVEVPLTNGWSVSSSDEAYDENNTETLTCTFRLPASGEYTDTHNLIASIVFRDPDSNNVKYTVTSVSGAFIPS